MEELYSTNTDFKEYVDRYAECNKISKEEALRQALVKEYAKYIQLR